MPSPCETYSDFPHLMMDGKCVGCGQEKTPALGAQKQHAPLTVRSIDGSPTQIIAEIDGREVGRMSITIMPLVHDMEIPASPIQRKVADALFYYASGKVKAAGFSEALALVAQDNQPMQAYVIARSVREEESSVFVMGVQ